MKYYVKIEFSKLFEQTGKYTATSKARLDVENVLLGRNFETITIKRHFLNSVLGNIELLIKVGILWIRLKRNDLVFLQYPIMNLGAFRFCFKSISKARVIAIVHDLPSYRFNNQLKFRNTEIRILNSFSHIIVHTVQMKKVLMADGVNTKIDVLEMFDYLLPIDLKCVLKRNVIVFAGALHKSLFLKKMDAMTLSEDFNLYGAYNPQLKNRHLHYRGKFLPNDISKIEGDWGLLWDGDDIEQCSGQFGKYLQIIAPHKFSLYIASGLKILVWKESAMASLVEKYHVGLKISKLSEIHDVISALSEEERELMEKNVLILSERIRKGNAFGSILSNILNEQ